LITSSQYPSNQTNIFSIGFNNLPLSEQMRLLQGSWGEILSLTLVYRTLESSNKHNGRSASSDYKKDASKQVVNLSSSTRYLSQVNNLNCN
jgi:hypothetical protein